MRLQNNYLASTEAIAFQPNEQLYKDILDSVAALRKELVLDDNAIKKSMLADAINKHTNITIIPHIVEHKLPNARIQTPAIDKNHPLLDLKNNNGDNWHGRMVVKYAKDHIGYVDLKTSKVHGAFAKLGFHLFVHTGLLDNRISDEEVAALLLHELGHIFTYFEYIGCVVTTNYALSSAAEACFNEVYPERRVAILETVKKDFELDIDPAELSTTRDPEAIQIVLSDAFVKQKRSMLGSDIYDMTGWEFLSDQFAVRHGAGLALARIIDRVSKSHDPFSYRTNATFLAMEGIKLATFLGVHFFTTGVSSIFYILVGIFFNPISDIYDRPRDRVVRVKEQAIAGLKDRTTPKAYRAKLIADIEAIEAIEKMIKSRRTLFQFIFTSVIPLHRRQWKQQILQKKLEELTNNPIFVSAAKLDTLDL